MFRWMKYLGYKYCDHKKYYYTDENKREYVVRDRNDKFLIDYFEAEFLVYRCVQIKESVAIHLEKNDSLPFSCIHYYFKELNGELCSYREYHVHTHDSLLNYVNIKNKKYGENLSIKRNLIKNPLIIIGQDESLLHQYIFLKKSWKGVKGIVGSEKCW